MVGGKSMQWLRLATWERVTNVLWDRYTVFEVGNPKQRLEVDVDMLSHDFYTIVTTSGKGVSYSPSASDTHGLSPFDQCSRAGLDLLLQVSRLIECIPCVPIQVRRFIFPTSPPSALNFRSVHLQNRPGICS